VGCYAPLLSLFATPLKIINYTIKLIVIENILIKYIFSNNVNSMHDIENEIKHFIYILAKYAY